MNPQLLEIEVNLLNAYMSHPDIFDKIEHLVSENIFLRPATKASYRILKQFHQQRVTPDFTLLFSHLKKLGFHQSDCATITGSNYDISYTYQTEKYVEILFKNSAANYLIPILADTHQKLLSGTGDTMELITKIKDSITNIDLVANNVSKEKTTTDIFDETLAEIKEAMSSDKGMGYSTGLHELDKFTGGLYPGIIVIGGRPGMGKCLGYGTKIVMFDGTLKEVQDIVIGDKLMGVDSKTRTVMSLARGQENMYIIKQKQGIDYRVNESHILSLKYSRNDGKHKNGDVINISVKDYNINSNKIKNNLKGYKTEVEFEEKYLSLDPYFIGLWLGDGTSKKPEITTPDKEIVDYLHEFADKLDHKITVQTCNGTRCPQYSIVNKDKNAKNGHYCLQTHLKQINIFDNKHIPQEYLINSKSNRLLLLAGIVDTDGYYNGTGSYEIIQKDTNLANQIKFLADSLGFKTSIQKKIGTIKSRNFKGEYNKVVISGNIDIIPVRIERKKCPPLNKNKNWRVNGIEVVPDGFGDYYGFTLDQDGLFLLEDFTVTHNTALTVKLIVENAINNNVPVVMFSLEMPAKQMMRRIMSNAARVNSYAIKTGQLNEDDYKKIENTQIRLKNNLIIDDTPAITWQYVDAKLRNVRKKHPITQEMIVIIDYMQLMSNTADEAKGRTDEALMSIRCNKMNAMWKTYNACIIELSQLGREVERRSPPRPKMSDLKDSGALEANADVVILQYRPDYYEEFPKDEKGADLRGLGELNIAKNRHGKVGSAYAKFMGQYSDFEDFSPNNQIYT